MEVDMLVVTDHAIDRLEERFYNLVVEEDPVDLKRKLLLEAVKGATLLGEGTDHLYYYGSIDGEADCIIVVRKDTNSIVTVMTPEGYLNQR